MLVELTIRNFAVIRETRLEFAPGLNALTGETGAGKSIVIDALGAVLGARTSAEFVRSGSRGAYVEAVFDLAALADAQPVIDTLASFGIEHERDEPLVLARDVTSSGRSTARIASRAVTAAALAQVGRLLVDIHGQSDHLSLLRPAAQLELLDRFAGATALRHEVGEAWRRWESLRSRVRDFDMEQRAAAQRLDLLRFQSEELGGAEIQPGEDVQLQHERAVLANAERLARAAADARAALAGDESAAVIESGALERIRAASRALDDIVVVDQSLEATQTRLRDALFALEDVVAEMRDYGERSELNPARLEQVVDRLDLLRNLKRKYGPELDDVIAHAEAIQREIETLEGREQDVEQLRDEEESARKRLGDLAAQLSKKRRLAASELAARVERAIAELNMGRATFEARFETSPDPEGVPGPDRATVAVDSTGYDCVAFYLAANAGEDPRPLARVASGGETARLMLAMKSILSEADETPILVFDEIDVGVGGRSGQVVGEKLWGLTNRHQAIVISHLPQIAAFADRHLRLVKSEVDRRTVTTAEELNDEQRIEELAAMLDGHPVTAEARANATALLQRVNEWKTARGAGGSSSPPEKVRPSKPRRPRVAR